MKEPLNQKQEWSKETKVVVEEDSVMVKEEEDTETVEAAEEEIEEVEVDMVVTVMEAVSVKTVDQKTPASSREELIEIYKIRYKLLSSKYEI